MEETNEFMQVETKIVKALKTVFDPEIPVNVYDLGLIYFIDVQNDTDVTIEMTLTAPNCPMADELVRDVENAVRNIERVKKVTIKITFNPPWSKDMMSEEALLELGFL